MCQGPVVDAAILSSRCNWATDTRAPRAPPLPYVKVHPSSLRLLHRLSNCMPKTCAYTSASVCARACLPASSRSNPEGHKTLCWVVSFFNGAHGASFVPVCSGRNHHGAPSSLPRKEKGREVEGERERSECLSALIQTQQSLCLCHNLFSKPARTL